jgi:thiamine kinase-like enzyme
MATTQEASKESALTSASASTSTSTPSSTLTTPTPTTTTTEYLNNAQQVLPISVDISSPQRDAQISEIVTTFCPFFTNNSNVNANVNYIIQPLNGGLSNDLFVVSQSQEGQDSSSSIHTTAADDADATATNTTNTATALVRIHPSGDSAQVVDRQVDNLLSAWLSEQDMAPIFYGRFENGRVEEFYPNVVPLSCHEMKVNAYAEQIATCLAQFHKLELPTSILEKPSNGGTSSNITSSSSHFDSISSWFTLALPQEMSDTDREFLNMVHNEWKWLQHQLQTEIPPTHTTLELQALTFIRETVFCHMDCQSLNIMKDTFGSLKLIDFEYAGWNPRAADLANTFCEHCDMNNLCANYQDEYPSKATQTTFLTTYLRHANPELAQQLDQSQEWENVIELWRKEIGRFTLMSHIGWTVWSILKSKDESGIDFDYLEYARHRMQGYRLFQSWYFTEIP